MMVISAGRAGSWAARGRAARARSRTTIGRSKGRMASSPRRQPPGRRRCSLQLDDNLVELACEFARHSGEVVLDDRRAGVLANVEGLVERETNSDGTLNRTLGDLLAVYGESAGPALADAATGVVEIERDRVLARRESLI